MCKYPWQDIDRTTDSPTAMLLRLIGHGRQVLEVGCASGYVSKIMNEELQCAVTGIEIDDAAAREAERYCRRVIVGDVDAMDLPAVLGDERFDVITFGDVLEHLKRPDTALATIRSFLNPDGFVLASIPNIAHISVALELLEGNFEYRPLGLLDDTHLRFFTRTSILKLFQEAGYEVVHWDRFLVRPEDTEFRTVLDVYPDSLLTFFGSRPEATSYQFIVKAVPAFSGAAPAEDKAAEAGALQEMRRKLSEQGKLIIDLKKKEAMLESILRSWSWRITAPLRRLRSIAERLRKKTA